MWLVWSFPISRDSEDLAWSDQNILGSKKHRERILWASLWHGRCREFYEPHFDQIGQIWFDNSSVSYDVVQFCRECWSYRPNPREVNLRPSGIRCYLADYENPLTAVVSYDDEFCSGEKKQEFGKLCEMMWQLWEIYFVNHAHSLCSNLIFFYFSAVRRCLSSDEESKRRNDSDDFNRRQQG